MIDIVDTHIHIIYDYDDGSKSLSMALDMLKMAYDQGARHIFCTSHSIDDPHADKYKALQKYKDKLFKLQTLSRSLYPDLTLYSGCEILCSYELIDDVLDGLEKGLFLPYGNTRYVLTELYPDTTCDEAIHITKLLISKGWKPILAHTERYPALFEGNALDRLIESGVLFQINLYSLEDEQNEERKNYARHLVNNKMAHFVGSDAHRSDRRPPRYLAGIEYLEKHCERDYIENICHKNALEKLMK